ncbi:MAG: hypothetical protein ACRER4_07340 [Steroidobacteraceae bacterium]
MGFLTALGWTDSHLHEFIINGMCYAEHQRHLAWRGGSSDPAQFDREAVNRALTRVKA